MLSDMVWRVSLNTGFNGALTTAEQTIREEIKVGRDRVLDAKRNRIQGHERGETNTLLLM